MESTLDTAIDDYRIHQVSMGYADNSVQVAQVVLRQLRKHVGGTPLGAIKSTHIAEFMIESGKTRSPRSLHSTHAQLCSFFKWARVNGRINHDPMFGRRPPKFVDKERTRIPSSDFPDLLDVAGQDDPSVRALCAIGLYALLRDSEITALEVRDVHLDECTLFAKIQKSKVEDLVPINAALHAELRRWLLHYESVVGTLRPEYKLIPRIVIQRGERLSNGRYASGTFGGYNTGASLMKASERVTPVLAELGVKVVGEDGRSLREGAHTLRRSGARALYDALTEQGRGDSLRIVQTMLHHKNIIQTQHYIGLNPDRETRDSLLRGAVLFDFERSGVSGYQDGTGEGLRLVR